LIWKYLDKMGVYKTITLAVEEIIFKEKKSKFIGYAYPVEDDAAVKLLIENLRKAHPHARHFCFAYRIGIDGENYRAFDDGEPNNSAGTPIYGQILSLGLTNILVVVVRYFGGVKLGVGGLVSAYKISAQLTLEQAVIIEKEPSCNYKINCGYKDLSQTQKILKNVHAEILQIETAMDCKLEIKIPESEEQRFLAFFEALYEVSFVKE